MTATRFQARLLALLLLALLVAIAHGGALDAGFAYDSHFVIEQDPRLAEASLANLRLVLGRDYWWPHAEGGLYRPVTTLSYLAHTWVHGAPRAAWPYRAVNLLLHTLVAGLLAALVLELSGDGGAALAAAALFAVHPITVEAVTNLVGRADLLATLFLLLGLLAWRRDRLGLALAAGTLAVFAKETGVALAPLALLSDLARPRPRAGRLRPAVALLLLPALAFALVRFAVLGSWSPVEPSALDNPLVSAGFWRARATAVAVLGKAFGLLLWPAELSPDYSFAAIPLVPESLLGPGAGRFWLGALALAALPGLAALAARRRADLAFFLVWPLVLHLPTSNLVVIIGSILAERFLYAPALGIAAVAALATAALARRLAARRSPVLVVALGTVTLVALGARSVVRNRDWHDDVALWSAAVRTVPASYRSHYGLAMALHGAPATRANLEREIAAWEASLAVVRSLPQIEIELAAAWRRRGDSDGGDPTHGDYARASELLGRTLATLDQTPPGPGHAQLVHRAWLELGLARARRGDAEGALGAFGRSVASDPLDPEPHRQAFGPLLELGRPGAAAIALWQAVLVAGEGASGSERGALARLYQENPALGCGGQEPGRCPEALRHRCAAGARQLRSLRQAGLEAEAGRLEPALAGCDPGTP